MLGNWYGTALFWKPQVALFLSTNTLLPVFVPLAPANTVQLRLKQSVEEFLRVLSTPEEAIAHEISAFDTIRVSKTADRSILGSLNEMVFHAKVDRDHFPELDLNSIALKLVEMPCKGIAYRSPLCLCQERLGSRKLSRWAEAKAVAQASNVIAIFPKA